MQDSTNRNEIIELLNDNIDEIIDVIHEWALTYDDPYPETLTDNDIIISVTTFDVVDKLLRFEEGLYDLTDDDIDELIFHLWQIAHSEEPEHVRLYSLFEQYHGEN
jgi:hypothetical protein